MLVYASERRTVGPKYDDSTGAPFYQDLMRILNEVNERRVRSGMNPVTFREALLAMEFRHDSVSGKIKSGSTIPSNNRLEALAEYLGIDVTSFAVYVQRFAEAEIEAGRMIETYRKMMGLSEHQRSVLQAAIDKYVGEIVSNL